jgi:hypothetical protein
MVAIGLFILLNIPATGLILVLLVLACPISLILIAKTVDHDLDIALKQGVTEMSLNAKAKHDVLERNELVETS